MTTYLSYELLDVSPARLFDAAETTENFAEVLESKAGSFQVSWLSENHPWERKFNWFCSNRQDIQDVRNFLYRRQGKYSPFWVPTWTADFLLLQSAAINSDALIVHDSGMNEIRDYVAVITPVNVYPRNVLSYTDNLDGTRTLTLDAVIPVALALETTLISYLSFGRLSADEMILDFVAMDACEVELDFVELPVPA